MSEDSAPKPGPGDQWFVVDLGRIMRLPERLRRLWPRELMPHTESWDTAVPREKTASRETAETRDAAASRAVARAGESAPRNVMLKSASGGGSNRGFDVLTAWLTGFAAELNLTHARLTVVISSGAETVHLGLGLCEDRCLAILALHGEGLEEFDGFELLRRIGLPELGDVIAGLGDLVDGDCVLTLTHMSSAGDAGLEFLHRIGSRWFRPTLERRDTGISVGAEVDAGDAAIRTLLASVLAGLVAALTPAKVPGRSTPAKTPSRSTPAREVGT